MAIDGAPPALLDGAPSARLPESEAGVKSEVGVESEADVDTEKPLTVKVHSDRVNLGWANVDNAATLQRRCILRCRPPRNLKRPIAPYISLWRAIGRVRAKYLNRLDMMISESPAINARRHKCELAGAQGMAAH